MIDMSRFSAPLLRNKWTRIPAGLVLWPTAFVLGTIGVLRDFGAQCPTCGRSWHLHYDWEYQYTGGRLEFHNCQYRGEAPY